MKNMIYWTHLCENKIIQIEWDQVCPKCHINSAVESLRYQGHVPTEPKKQGLFSKLFKTGPAVKKTKKQNYEFQDDYNDRHG